MVLRPAGIGGIGTSSLFGPGANRITDGLPAALLERVSTAALFSLAERLEIPNIAFSNTLLQTYYHRREIEAPFDQVRIRISNVLANTNGGFTVALASTETPLRDTLSHAFEPISSGTAFNSVVTSGPGWRAVTWGGAASSGNCAAGNVQETSVLSDWISVPSLARADGSLRPLLLARIMSNSPTTGTNSVVNYSKCQIIGDRYDIDYSRTYEIGVVTGSDGVANLATEPTHYLRVSASDLAPLISFEFKFRGSVVATSIVNCGDSVSGGVQSAGGVAGDSQDGWQQRAILGVSTPDMPLVFMNMAQSGQTSAVFIPALTAMLNGGLRPKMILIPTSSRNDGYGATSIIDTYFGLVDTLIALCATLNPRPKIVMWYDPPKWSATHGGSSSEDTVRFYGFTLAQNRLSGGTIDAIIDTNTPVAVGSPQTWDTADNLHPANGNINPSFPATPLLASALKSYLRPTFGPLVMRPATFFTGFSFSQVGSNSRCRPAQISGSGTITRLYAWFLAGVPVGTNSVVSPTWAAGDIGKVPTCVETVSGDGTSVQSTATFPAVVAAVSNLVTPGSNTLSSYATATDITFAQNATDPFGNANSAWTVTEGVASAAHSCLSNSITFTNGQIYTQYMYVKAGTQTAFQMAFDSTRFGATAYANFDLTNGYMGFVSGSILSSGLYACEEAPGWYLCWMTAQCTSSGAGACIFKVSNSTAAGRNVAYTGTGLNQIWYNGQVTLTNGPQAPVVT